MSKYILIDVAVQTDLSQVESLSFVSDVSGGASSSSVGYRVPSSWIVAVTMVLSTPAPPIMAIVSGTILPLQK